jgi:serine/threonine protein kinase
MENLGEGGFGKLQLYKCKKYCTNYNCNKCVVIKTMKKNDKNFESNKTFFINHFYNEFYMTIHLNHPNIRKTLNIDKKNDTMTFEYCRGIDLIDYLFSYKGNTKFLLHLYSQILDGVEYLHNNNIAHLDLKLENIIVYNNHIKIIDFGESMFYKIDGKEIMYRGLHGTELCMPPEMIQRKLYKPNKVDIWCCGILLYNIITPYTPWEYADHKTDKLYARFKYTLEHYNKLDEQVFKPLDSANYSINEQKIIMTIFKHTFQINPNLRKPVSMLKSIFNLIDWETNDTNTQNNTCISKNNKNISHKKIRSISN